MPLDPAPLRREEFAALGDVAYLNAASTGPIPRRGLDAGEAFARRRGAPHTISQDEQFGVLSRARALVAELIGANSADVALSINTGAGLNLAAWGLPLGPGDVVVLPDLEFPANVYPWLAAAEANGFSVKRVPAKHGLLDEDALLAAIEEDGVRVLTLSWVSFSTGYTADLARLGAACRARGVWFIVDAIQGLGALELDVRTTPVDLVACGAQKWLLSPWGTGFTWVSPAIREVLGVQPVSWMAVRGSDDFSRLLDYDLTWRDDARRYEQVTLPFQDFAGMVGSLELLLELGAEAVAEHIQQCAEQLASGAALRYVDVVTPRERHAGIVSLRPRDWRAASSRLDASGVIHSVREGTIRLAPHVYTTPDDIERALNALGEWA